jgi:hypothetical protein
MKVEEMKTFVFPFDFSQRSQEKKPIKKTFVFPFSI